MNIFNLFASLVLKNEAYKRGIAEAKQENKGFEENTKKTTKATITFWTAVIAILVKVAQAIGKAIVSTAEFGAEIRRSAQAAGLAVEEYQEWAYVMQQAGGDASTLTSIMKNLSAAAENNDSDLRKLIGTVKDSNGQLKSQSQLFRESLKAIQAIENPTERAAMANKVLGKSYTQLGDILKMTTTEIDAMINQGRELGIVLSEEIVNAADKLTNELASMKTMTKAYFAELVFGDPEKADEILDRYIEKVEELIPKFVAAGIRIFFAVVRAINKIIPELVPVILEEFIANLIPENFWEENGLVIAGKLIRGIVKGIGRGLARLFGINIGTSEDSNQNISSASTSNISRAYTSSTTVTQTMEVTVKAEGDGALNQKAAGDVGKVIYDYIAYVEGTR